MAHPAVHVGPPVYGTQIGSQTLVTLYDVRTNLILIRVRIQIILVPGYVGQSCLLLNGTLSTKDLEGCSLIPLRSFGTFGRFINGIGYLTGANTLDVAKIGLDQGLLTQNQSLVTDAYGRVHAEVVIQQSTTADGIRPDGSFGQHSGILYNGNYGKD